VAPIGVVVDATVNHAGVAAIVAISNILTPKPREERIMILQPLSFWPQISTKIFSI